jgi:cytoskeletal protein CcmA (bactofilin family)
MFKGFKSKAAKAQPPEEQQRPAAAVPEVPPAPPENLSAPEVQFRRLEDRSGPDDSVISAQAIFKGKISGRAGARIAGEVEGDIRCDGLVWVRETGRVKGNIVSGYVILEGALEGDIGPALQVELRSTARMRGNIRTLLLAVAEGTQFEGRVDMEASSLRPARFAEKRQSKPGRG